MKQYVEASCASARFRITGGVLLEHDLAWDRGSDSTPETMRRYYFLQSQDVITKDPPLPTKSERILFWSHATDVGALWNMLKDRDMLPMNAHGVEKFGFNIFCALGHEVSGSEIDEYNISRVIFNAARSAKNLAGIVVNGKAWGSLKKHLGGSYETARAATKEDEVIKDANGKASCISRDRFCFNPIAFDQLAQPPSTAQTLITPYQKAANIAPGGRQLLMQQCSTPVFSFRRQCKKAPTSQVMQQCSPRRMRITHYMLCVHMHDSSFVLLFLYTFLS